jgi:hypothetical protein
MKEWEYMYIEADNNEVEDKFTQSSNLEEDYLHEFLNDAGKQGWELVSTCPKTASEWRLVFKRPAQE